MGGGVNTCAVRSSNGGRSGAATVEESGRDGTFLKFCSVDGLTELSLARLDSADPDQQLRVEVFTAGR